MTDYKEGKWYGWTGGNSPVHPDSIITVKWSCNGVETSEYPAKNFSDYQWQDAICAFRIVKLHREPREWWITGCDSRGYGDLWPTRAEAEGDCGCLERVIHVREVLE